jgi:hypothetical protein
VEQLSEVALSDDDGDVSGGDGGDGAAARREALRRQLELFTQSRAGAAAAAQKRSGGGGGGGAAVAPPMSSSSSSSPAAGLELKPPAHCAEQRSASRQCGRRGGSLAACVGRAPAAAPPSATARVTTMTSVRSCRGGGVRVVAPPQLRARPCGVV